MTDVDEGRLLAWMDGELDRAERAEVEARLREDDAAAARLETVRGRADAVRAALGTLDVAPPTERVRRRLRSAARGRRRSGTSPGWATRSRLAQAAVLVLLLAGGASAALPGSPLRRFLERTLGDDPAPPAARTPGALTAPGAVAADAAGAVGLWTTARGGELRIDLEDVPPGTGLVVTLVEGERGGVAASEGTSLRSGEGRVQASVASGPVRVEMPRDVRRASLRVDGREYIVVVDGEVRLLDPSAERAGDTVRIVTAGG